MPFAGRGLRARVRPGRVQEWAWLGRARDGPSESVASRSALVAVPKFPRLDATRFLRAHYLWDEGGLMSNFFVGCTNDQLREVDLFADLDEATLDDLKMHSHFIGAHPGLHVIRQDGAGFDLYVILSGDAEVRRNNEVVAKLGKGDVFGEMAVLSSHHRNADVVATSVMSMMTMTAGDLAMVTEKYPEIERRIRQLAEARQST